MKMHPNDIPVVFAQYLDQHIMPKANGWQKFGAGAAAFVIQQRLPHIMEQYGPTMAMAGILGEDGLIDIDMAYSMGKFGMEKAGTVNIAGYLMDSSDIEQIYQISKNYAR